MKDGQKKAAPATTTTTTKTRKRKGKRSALANSYAREMGKRWPQERAIMKALVTPQQYIAKPKGLWREKKVQDGDAG